MSALIAFGFGSLCKDDNKTLIYIGSGLMSLCMLFTAFGLSLPSERATANVRVLTIVFFVLALISNLIFAFVPLSSNVYIIANGLLLLIWLLVVFSIGKANQ